MLTEDQKAARKARQEQSVALGKASIARVMAARHEAVSEALSDDAPGQKMTVGEVLEMLERDE